MIYYIFIYILFLWWYQLNKNKALVVFAITAALGLLGIVVLEMTVLNQEVSAGCERGPAVNQAFAGSKGKCFDRGTF